jgi:sensor histidine kinase YesM
MKNGTLCSNHLLMRSVAIIVFTLVAIDSANCQDNIEKLKRVLCCTKSDTARVSLLIKLSDAYRAEDPQKALEFARKSNDICKKRPADKYTANSLLQVAICQMDLFDYSSSQRSIDCAIAIFKKVKDYKDLAIALNSKGRIYDYKAEYPVAVEYFTEALSIAQKHGFLNEMSQSHNNLGFMYSRVGDMKKAYLHMMKAIRIDSLLNHKESVSEGYVNLGLILEHGGNYNKSLNYYHKAYEINLKLNNKIILAKVLTNIGNIYFETKEFRKALWHYFESIKIKKQISDIQGVANSYSNIACTYIQLKKMDSTFYYLKESLKIYTKINDKQSVGRTYGNLGSACLMVGNEKEALTYIGKGLKIRNEIGDKEGMARGYLSLGELYNKKNSDVALRNYNKALSCAEKSNTESLKMECFQKISAVYEKQNRTSDALLYYKKYHDISDTIYNHQNQKLLLELQTKYETAAKDNEIKNLNSNNEITQLSLDKSKYLLRRQQLIIGIIVFVFLLSACFGLVYFRLFRQRKRMNQKLECQNAEIEQQNQEISTQRDHLKFLNQELEVQKEKVMNQRDSIEAELKKTLLASEILQRENIQFKFEALKSQLNPHFLFNTFSTLISLIQENPLLAEKYTQNLSNVYRYILSSKDKELVMLKEELDFIDSYMFLISIRFDDNVTVEINVEKELLEYYLPLLSLQLLLENAVKHNVVSKRKPLHISINSDGAAVVVRNNLQKKSSIENSTKIGLKNIKNRYELICSEKVDIKQSDDHFSVKLPLVKEYAL